MTPRYSLEADATRNYPVPPAFSLEKVGQEQPGKGLYTEYVNRLPFATDRIFNWQLGRVAVPTLEFDKTVYPAPVWVEIFHVYAGGTGIGVPFVERMPMSPEEHGPKPPVMSGGFGHAHDFDELFLFIGCDPHDTLNLGGEVETWLGEGDEAEKFILTKASSVFVPAGVVHNPQYFRRVDRPYLMVVIALTSDYSIGNMRSTPLPPGFKL